MDKEGGAFRWLGGGSHHGRAAVQCYWSRCEESDGNPTGRITTNAEVTDCFRTEEEQELEVSDLLIESRLVESNPNEATGVEEPSYPNGSALGL